MKPYIGTKRVNAKPMNRADYNALRGWEVPADEDPADDGYLVEYLDGGKANHPEFKGYISWSPKDVFERAYKHTRTGNIAPHVTPADIESNIIAQHFFTAAQGSRASTPQQSVHESLDLLTICVLVLRNGFTVTGESACVSPENFNAEVGCKVARQHAVEKIWPLMGYALKEELAHG